MTKKQTKAIHPLDKFGKWLVIKEVKVIQKRSAVFKHYLCRCACGTEKIVRSDSLRHGRSTQCENCRKAEKKIKVDSFIGTTVGNWKIIKTTINPKRPLQQSFLCQCKCGLFKIIDASKIKLRKNLSCHLCNVTKHGYEGSPTYSSWKSMKQRCNNPNHTYYRYYGGRGISVCVRWNNSFEAFLEDMGERPSKKQLDRINNNDGYYKENCRWVSPKENSNNRNKRKRSSQQ